MPTPWEEMNAFFRLKVESWDPTYNNACGSRTKTRVYKGAPDGLHRIWTVWTNSCDYRVKQHTVWMRTEDWENAEMFYLPIADMENTNLDEIMMSCEVHATDATQTGCTFQIPEEGRFGWMLAPGAEGIISKSGSKWVNSV